MKSNLIKEKKLHYGKNIGRAQYLRIMGHDEKTRKRAYYALKNIPDYADLCQAADFLDKNVPAKFKNLLYGNPLPADYSQLGVCEFSYTGKHFIHEINWTLIAVRKYADSINLFLAYKELYESNFLLGNYNEAEKYLDRIEAEVCCSLWTLENRFLIKEFAQTSSESKNFLSKFNEENQARGYTKSLAHYLSLRAEKTLAASRFHAELENALSAITGKKKKEHTDYYLFKLSFLNIIEYTSYVELLAYDFQHSIIDRYLNLRKVLSILLTTANSMVEKEEEGKSIKSYVLNRINYMVKKINDQTLFKLKLFAGDKMFTAFDSGESKREIAVIDKYTTGFYHDVEIDLNQLLLEKPTQFDLYELYVKSLIYQRKPFQFVGNNKSLQNQILFEMYRLISVNVDPVEPSTNLFRIANNLSSSILSYGIVDFVSFQTKGASERRLMARLSFNPANPAINEIFPDASGQAEYLHMLLSKFPESITIQFFYNKLTNVSGLLDFENKLPDVIFKTEYGKELQKAGKYEQAASIWETLITDYQDMAPVFETAIRHLYVCYEKLRKYDSCIKLFVDSFFANHFIIEKIETQSLIETIKENRFKTVKPEIELPIFYTITNADENERHTTYEKFNLGVGVCKASELIGRFNEFEFAKILFYLKYTCTPDLFKHSIHITGSKERLEERLVICQFLREKDTYDKDFYDDEIKYITNILVIQKGLLELDESKIYVNEKGIVANELKEYESVYQRYKTIGGIRGNKLVVLHGGKLTTLEYTEENTSAEQIEYSSNPVFDIYKDLFSAIKDKFLNSKFGIVAYLSTRIRHGVLLGEIRPIFEKHKLITLIDSSTSTYRKNQHWDNIYQYQSAISRAKLQDILKEFSLSVDGLIYDLIKKYLQVYEVKSNPAGWFNYDFGDNEIFWHSIKALKSRDFNDFAQQVFDVLWERTDTNLKLIRSHIQGQILDKFNELFDRLESDVFQILDPSEAQYITSSIRACSTETQTIITRISSWFKRSGTTASDFQIDNLIDIVMDYANKTHPTRKIDLEQDIQFNCKIKGEYLTHFADLLRIFIENILKHSNDKVPLINAKISTSQEADNLVIKIENQVTNQESLQALFDVLNDKSIATSKLLSEGKSGYHKAFKIIRSDLQNETNRLITSISEDRNIFSVTMYIAVNELIA